MIQVTFPDQSVREFPDHSTPLEIAQSIGSRLAKAVLGAAVNDQPWDLTRPLQGDSNLQLYTWNDAQGREVYRHSSTHLMAQAIQELYPDAKLTIGPPLEDRYYYDIDVAAISEDDFPKIEARMMELAKQDLPITCETISRETALALFQDNPYKTELINALPSEAAITIYRQGTFLDLCRGPHLPSTGMIKAVKLLSVAGAFWRGDAGNAQLQRLYGTSYPSQKELDEHMARLEEARARDHRKLGRELGLFVLSPEVGAGLPLWTPKGTAIRRALEVFIRAELEKRGYESVVTPHIANASLFEKSGHAVAYVDSMFPFMERDGDRFALKPVNCPMHIELYASSPRSYRDLPVRYAEFGTVYRWELSGEVGGLTRVRGFTQDDAHIFMRPDQLVEEFKSNVELVLLVLGRLGLSYTARVGLRDPESDKYVGSDEAWEQSQASLLEAVESLHMDHTVELGEAAIYGPKLDFVVNDAIGRQWQLGTVQVDYVLPERFELEYTGSDGGKHRPVMIHRAPFGSLERFVGVLIEHFAGAFPLWLAPVQIEILPIADRHFDYAADVVAVLSEAGFRVEVNADNAKIGAKIAIAETQKVPYMAIIGDKEIEAGGVSLRARGRQDLGGIGLDALIEKLNNEASA